MSVEVATKPLLPTRSPHGKDSNLKASILASILATLLFACLAGVASADGSGSPDDCTDGPSTSGDADHLEYEAPDGYVVDGVCIKSGSNTFEGDKHSEPLGDGFYDHDGNPVDEQDACYSVSGVGTQTVEVDRNFSSSDCQSLSHIDVITSICSDCQNPCESQDPPPECGEDPCLGEDPPEECGNPCEGQDPPPECTPILDCDDPEFAAENPECDPETLTLCIDGDIVSVEDTEELSDTGNCDPVRLCVDGESVTLTEFEADQIDDADPGSCTPSEDPPLPGPTTPTTPGAPAPVQQVAGVVEQAALTEEVAALPSAGYGDTDNQSLLWLVLTGTLLAVLSLSTVMTARLRK